MNAIHASLRGFRSARALFVVGFLLLHSPETWAGSQGRISGTVRDRSTKQPMPAVNVVIDGTSMGCASDLSGDYVIPNVAPGVYTVRATMLGYRPLSITNVTVQSDRTTEVNIEMEETTLNSTEVVVVTAERPLVEKGNTSSRQYIEPADLMVRATTDFTTVLTSLPGINEQNGVVTFRGGTLDQVAFIVDGARTRNPLDQTAYANFNLSSIQEVEVITGSFNAEYGEAQSGVVNIVTKEGGEKYRAFIDVRYQPPGIRHWGVSLYDRSTGLYWENTHARHLEWWVDHPDQWVDPNGVRGNDPQCVWTPEQAFSDYLKTHQPLTDYTHTPSYQTEISFSGPGPEVKDLSFFLSVKYRSQAPLFGNAYRAHGEFFNGTAKFSYGLNATTKLQLSGFYGFEKTSWGISDYPDYDYASNYGYQARYAYYDFPGLPTMSTNGQTLRFSSIPDAQTMYELRLSRVQYNRRTEVLPGDPNGWSASGVTTTDNLRAVDSLGFPIGGAYANPIGYNTLGYYFRNNDHNTDYSVSGSYSSQLTKNWSLKAGLDFTWYTFDHFNESKRPAVDSGFYTPYQGDAYVQNTLEFGGFILNFGLRFDFYNPNDTVYENPFDPMISAKAPTKTFSQLSPRLGIAHPIDEKTVLHFSYGHFFERGPFADYGEGYSDDEARGSLTRFLDPTTGRPVILGNRQTKPQKTVSFEVGIERNFADLFVLDLTGYYKDITNTIRIVQIVDPTLGISYRTNGNGNYADVRGLEVSIRKLPSHYVSGYINYTTQLGVSGRGGDPTVIYPTKNVYGTSGDFINYYNPILKAALFVQTPRDGNILNGILDDVLFSFEYTAVYPNDRLLQDVFRFADSTGSYVKMRPADESTRLKLSKGFSLFGNSLHTTVFMEVTNVFNDKWVNFGAVERAAPADQKRFVQSDMTALPSRNVNGVPLLDTSKYRNLPRAFVFGLTVEL